MRHSLIIVCFLLEVMASKAQLFFNKPPSGGETVEIPEDNDPGTTLYSLQATQPGGNSPTFEISTQQCKLPLNASMPNFTINNLDQLLVPMLGLDAETCRKIEFTFNVTAGGAIVTSDPLTIIITDVNDNPPKFGKPSYSGDVWKNDLKGKTVNGNDTITALDPDISNLTVSLSISGAQPTFAINDSAGLVYVIDPSGLAALASPTVLTIQASDGNEMSTALLSINVHDDPCNPTPCQNGGTCNSIEYNPTCVCLSGYSGTYCESVDYCFSKPCQNNATCENEPSGYRCICVNPYINKNCSKELMPNNVILNITESEQMMVIPIDPLDNGHRIYTPASFEADSITLWNDTYLPELLNFTFNGSHLNFSRGIDRDTMNGSLIKFRFMVQIEEAVCNSSVTLNVSDVNDNAPKFDNDTETCSPVINDTDTVFTVSATDADITDLNKNVSFLLNGSDHFTIDSSSGNIKNTTSLKPNGVFNLSVKASDGAYEATASLRIVVYGNCSSDCKVCTCFYNNADDVCSKITTTTSTTTKSTTTTSTTTTSTTTKSNATTSTTTTSTTKTPTTMPPVTTATDETTETHVPTTADQNDGDKHGGLTNMIIGLSVAGACAIIILLAMICLYVHYKRLAQKKKYKQGSRHSQDTTMQMENAKQWQHKRPNQHFAGHHSTTPSDVDFQNQQLRIQVPHRHSVDHITRQSTPDHHYRYTVF